MISRELDARTDLAAALAILGLIHFFVPYAADTPDGGWRPFLVEALALFHELEDDEGIGATLRWFGFGALYAGDLATAEVHFTQSLAYARARGDRWGMSGALDGLGQTAQARDDAAAARRIFERKLELDRALRDHYSIGFTAVLLGELAHGDGDGAAARLYYRQALTSLRGTGAIWGIRAISGLAELEILGGSPVRALRLAAAGTGLSAAAGLVPTAATGLTPFARAQGRAELVRRAGQLVLSLDEQTAAWATGAAMTLEQAIAYALEVDEGTASVQTDY